MIERFNLQPGYSISRIIKGGWHLAGGHGLINKEEAIRDMAAFVEAGITTFDCADIYTGVEELIGQFLRLNRDAFTSGNLAPVQIHTKYVPDYNQLANLKKKDTRRIIDRSLRRLGLERLDLVQFAWWDYTIKGYVETALHLAELQKEGKIRYLGITNFDGAHLSEILDAGVPIIANQVQYSVMDQRVKNDQLDLCDRHDIAFLCYGTIAGGFLTDRYLNKPPPAAPLENRSLTKYRLIIDEFGGYDFFQKVLRVLRNLAEQYEVGIAEIACRYILQKPRVGGIIVGARNRRHLENLAGLSRFKLSSEDLQAIEKTISCARGPKGPFYALERDKEGKHGRIMKYNLNEKID